MFSTTADRYTARLHIRVCVPTALMDSCPECGACPDRQKPNTHAGQYAHLHTTAS